MSVFLHEWLAVRMQIAGSPFSAAVIERLRTAGIPKVEVLFEPGFMEYDAPGVAAAAGRQLREAGIAVWSCHLPFLGGEDISCVDETLRRKAVAVHTRALAAAQALGAGVAVIHPSGEPIPDSGRAVRFAQARRSLVVLEKEAAYRGVRLAVELLPRTCLGHTSRELLELIDGFDPNHVGVCLDANHANLRESLPDVVRALAGRLFTVHISDNDGVDEKHWLPGRGVIRWPEFFRALADAGYRGACVYETGGAKGGELEALREIKTNFAALLTAYLDSRTSVFRDIVFARTEQRPLRLDIRVPSGVNNPPLVLYIPMGGMTSCPKESAPWWLTECGFAMASIECRVSSEAIAPAQAHDCKAAVRWLRAHAGDYGYRADAIGAWGHSAGGLLAALLGTSGDVPELEGPGGHNGVSSRVQAVCDECGVPHDLAYFARPEVKARYSYVDDNIRRYLGAPVEDRLDLARRVSPRTYVSKDNPPMLLIHGSADGAVPVEEMIEFHDALRAAGVDVALRILPGIGHGWKTSLTHDDIVSFFKRTLSRGEPAKEL
ncbi:MAG: TIM barrel protein [Lentisphaerae bacterium]|nr:TIM barrel protein [Lentisphaerota bacterium]